MSGIVSSVQLVPFERNHADRTLEWNRDPELARLLDRSRAIEPDEHVRWFNGLGDRADTVFRAIEVDGRHIGNVWLADVDRRHRKAEVRIMIGKKDAVGAGAGSAAIDAIVRYGFNSLGLHRVYAYVLAFNPRARRAFEKAGFVLEGTLREDRWDGAGYTDVFLLGRVNHG